MKRKNRVLEGMMFLMLGIVLGILIISFIISVENKNNNPAPVTKIKVIDVTGDVTKSMQNMSLSETAYFINSVVNDIYKYRVSRDSQVLSFEDLKKYGGDCLDYSRFYNNAFSELGFKSDIIKINAGDVMHDFVIAYDKTGYCQMDMKNYKCYFYNN